jgi:hypothetical protein
MIKKLSILFLFLPVIVCGQYFPQPQTVTNGTPYCFRGGMSDKIQELPHDPGFFRVSEYGVRGDSATDDTDSITAVIALASAYYTSTGKKTTIYFKDGDYLTTSLNFIVPEVNLRGRSKNVTNIINAGTFYNASEVCNSSRIAFWGFQLSDQRLAGKNIKFESCKFMVPDRYAGASDYFHIWGLYQKANKAIYSKCDFWCDSIYMELYTYNRGIDTLLVDNCTFTGNWSWHPVRVDKADYFDISYNTVSGGVTGILLGSTRENILQGGKITHNNVYGASEELVSMDGFGNETGRCPVICQGPVTSATNDGNGRIIVTNTFSLRQGVHPNDTTAPTDISDRADWTTFYYSFVDSTLAGRYYKIYAFDTTHNTLTIDTIAPSSIIPIGCTATVDAGFFDIEIAYNTLHDSWGHDSTCATAISLWLNNFNVNVHHNTIYNCANGLNSAGGLMLSLYILKSWRANIHDNTFTNCSGGYGINFNSFYTNAYKQYDNILKDNVFTNSTVVINNQVRFTNTGNTITP